MRQLHFVGFTSDHDGLIFAGRRGAKTGDFVIKLDDDLLEQIDGARTANLANEPVAPPPPPPPPRPRIDSALSPREMQKRLRGGRTVAQVAAEAGVNIEWVERFAAPVLAEQAAAVARAHELILRTNRRGQSDRSLASSVIRNLADRGIRLADDEFDLAWTAFQLDDTEWVIRFRYRSRGRDQKAEWLLDMAAGTLVPHNRLGTELGFVDPGRHAPPVRELPPVRVRRSATMRRRIRRAAGTRKSAAPKKTRSAEKSAPATGRAKKAASKKRARVTKTAVTGKRAPAKRQAPAKKVAAAKRAGSARKAVGLKKAGAANKATAAKKAGTSKKAASSRRAAVSKVAGPSRKKAAPAKRTSPIKKTAIAQNKASPAKKVATAKRAAPAKKAATAKRPAPAKKAVPAKRASADTPVRTGAGPRVRMTANGPAVRPLRAHRVETSGARNGSTQGVRARRSVIGGPAVQYRVGGTSGRGLPGSGA